MVKKQVIAAALLVLWFPASVAAKDQHINGTWYVDFSGIPMAKLWLGVQENGDSFHLQASFKSTGLVRVIKKMKTATQSEGARRDGVMRTLWLDYQSRTEDKRTRLVFNEHGELIERLVVPEDDPNYRPRVPAADVTGVYTATDILFGLRAALQEWDRAAPEPLSFRLYDGQRLMDISLSYLDSPVLDGGEQSILTNRFAVSRTPLLGYTEKEQRKYAKGDPPLYLWLRRSDGFPVKMELPLRYGTVRGRWEEG